MNLDIEKKTVGALINIYCRSIHKTPIGSLCDKCKDLENYALMRLNNCKYQNLKPVCSKCKTHCYSDSMRVKIRAVMRFAGPRLLFRRPILSFIHLYEYLRSK